jgi:membrane protease YdiL (CAAX protease family)
MFFTIFLYGGPFNEEFGWRGFALERFQGKWSALISSIYLGIIWGFWHLPLFFIIGSSQEGQPFLLFVIMTSLLSILFTLIYNNTDGNILAAMLFHTMFNLTYAIIPFTEIVLGIIFFGILLIITDLLIIFFFGAYELNRKNRQLIIR